jgi:hypothetical protein
MRIVTVGLLLVCAWLTEQRAQQWQSDRTIWQAAIPISPTPRPHVNDGAAFQKDGDHLTASRSYYTAIALSYDERRTAGTNLYSRLSAQTNLALILIRQREVQSAWHLLEDVLSNPIWPNFPHARYHRGMLFAFAGDCAAARLDQAMAMRQDGMLRHFTPCAAPISQ